MGTGSFLGKLLHLELTKRAVRPHPLAVGGGGAKEVQLPRWRMLCADGAFSRGVIVWLLGVLGPENGREHGSCGHACVHCVCLRVFEQESTQR